MAAKTGPLCFALLDRLWKQFLEELFIVHNNPVISGPRPQVSVGVMITYKNEWTVMGVVEWVLAQIQEQIPTPRDIESLFAAYRVRQILAR